MRPTRIAAALAVSLLVLLFAPAAAAAGGVAAVAPLTTPAEAANFEATPGYDETLAFLGRLAERLPMKIQSFGTSAEGRPMPVVILSKDRAFTPEAAARAKSPVTLVVAGIHAGEIDGKDAMLLLLRDAATGADTRPLEAGTVLFVPFFNVDGHERVSPHHRPNQDGPRKGMGFRTTTAGLDLNRDHVKAVSPEMKALLALVNAWQPHLHVDNHVTDGCDFAWTLTYFAPEEPQVAPEVAGWLRAHLPPVLAAVEKAGYGVGPYVDLQRSNDPAQGFTSAVPEARLSNGYFALRQRPTILVENHSYKPYRERVLANRAFLGAVLAEVARAPRELTAAVAAAERRVVAAGGAGAPPSDVVLDFAVDESDPDRILFPVYDWTLEDSVVMGRAQARYARGVTRPIEVPWYHRLVPARTTPRPRGYLVLPGWPQIEERLRVHGLRTLRLSRPATVELELLRVADPEPATRTYQGQVAVKAKVTREEATRTVPAGTLYVPADQPGFEVAARLLEPESPDSLFAWGFLGTVTERKEYVDERVLEDFARAALRDPAVAEAWRAALEDPQFAADERARWLWWYRRTPWWDASFGVLPVLRVMRAGQKMDFDLRARTSR